MTATHTHYEQPGWFTQHVFNRLVDWLTRRGLSAWGSRVLEVPGRTSGERRRLPVNLLTHDGKQYLVSLRGTAGGCATGGPTTGRSTRPQDLVAAAFTILDAEGPDALTRRHLDDALGMQAPSLYKHVRDKATLEAALIEDVLFDIGDVLHAALESPGRRGVVARVLEAYRARSLQRPTSLRPSGASPTGW